MHGSNVRKRIKLFGLIAIVALVAFSALQLLQPIGQGVTSSRQPTRTLNAEMRTFDLEQILAAKEGDVLGVRGEVLNITNGVKHLVPLEEIQSVLQPDSIHSIDNPKFVSADEADRWLFGTDFVLGVEYNGVARAYPHLVLVWHEIVNDDFNGKPLLITYCPLCFTGIAFEPFVGGEAVKFGASGSLYNNDLVMFDRKTNSYWSQVTGQAIKGPLTGLTLKKVPIDTIRWDDWKNIHPDSQVLSGDRDLVANYTLIRRDPYGGYYTSPSESRDTRLPSKEIVFGVALDELSKAYPEKEVAKVGGLVEDVLGSRSLIVVQDPAQISDSATSTGIRVSSRTTRIFASEVDGVVLKFELRNGKLVDKQTGSEWSFEGEAVSGSNVGKKLSRIPSTPQFWFTWASFYPKTAVYLAP